MLPLPNCCFLGSFLSITKNKKKKKKKEQPQEASWLGCQIASMRNPIRLDLWRVSKAVVNHVNIVGYYLKPLLCNLKAPHAWFWSSWMFIFPASKNTHLHSIFSDRGEQSKWEASGSECEYTQARGLVVLTLSPGSKPITVEEII